MAQGNIVCVVNRTSKPLSVTKNGRVTVLKPGENYINSDLVRFAKNQHPLRGSQDPNNPMVIQYLVGIKAPQGEVQRDDISEITDEDLSMLPAERFDRSLLPKDRRNGEEARTNFPRGRVGMDQATDGIRDPGRFN